MTPAATSLPVALPDDPIRAALDDARIRDGLHAQARAVLGPEAADDAAEAVQEAAARAWQARATFHTGDGAVTAWLHGILTNVLHETMRKRRRRPAQLPDDPRAWDRLLADLSPADAVADRDAVAVLFARLPAEHRDILDLRYRHGLDGAALAARLGVRPGAARVRLCRALAAAKVVAGVAPGEVGP